MDARTVGNGCFQGRSNPSSSATRCTDDTAEVARAHKGVTVVDSSEASKIAAINLGDDAARSWQHLLTFVPFT